MSNTIKYPKASEPFEMLTARQYFILSRVSHGDTATEIAKEMGITTHSIYCTIKAIREKFGLSRKGKLALLFFAYAPDDEFMIENPRVLAGRVERKKMKLLSESISRVAVTARKASKSLKRLGVKRKEVKESEVSKKIRKFLSAKRIER